MGICAVGVALVSMAMATEAQAATKLCVGPKIGETIEVPPNPRFVLLSEEGNVDSRAREHLLRRGKTFGHTDELVDSYWIGRTVRAEDGHRFVMPLNNHFCSTPRYRVDRNWKRRSGVPVPMAAALRESDAGEPYVVLMWRPAKELSWTRIDWAYSRADLERGLHGSLHERESLQPPDSNAYVSIHPNATRVHLRLTRFHLDGTESRWVGWLERDAQDRMRIRTGEPPLETPSATDLAACADSANPARPVPVAPTFRTRRWDTPRFVAVTPGGDHLPIATRPVNERTHHAATTVNAGEGQQFWLRRLPLAPGCPTERLLVATGDRSRDEAPVITDARAPGCSARLGIADPDSWGYFEVSSQALTNEQVPDYLTEVKTIAADLGAPTMYSSPLLVTITPVWGEGQRGAAWTGRVQSEGCDEASFDALAVEPAAPQALPSATATIERPAPACSANRRGMKRWILISILLSLALGLLLYLRHRRRADRNMWV